MPTVQETIQKVNEFQQLPIGWHFGEGVPPPPERVRQAVNFLLFASVLGLERSNAFPGIRGQVEITFYKADRVLEITLESDDSITIAEDSDNNQIALEENRSRLDVFRKINEFEQSEWLFSDPFIVSITTQSVRVLASQVPHWISEAESHFPWLRSNVQHVRAAHYALISRGTTTSKLENLRFTGEYPMETFRQPVELRWREPLMAMTAIGTFTVGEEIQPAKPLDALN